MIKYLKSVGVLLFLSTVCNGTVYANQEGRKTDVRVTQQNGTCTGVVKDATGETIIGASVVVKGSTNGTKPLQGLMEISPCLMCPKEARLSFHS